MVIFVIMGLSDTTLATIEDTLSPGSVPGRHEGIIMPKIPDPQTLVEIARSTRQYINDLEWKKYQRYLTKYARNGHSPDKEPLNFEGFCATLGKNGNSSPNT